MYVPPRFAEPDTAVLHDLMRQRPLGTWVAPGGGELLVNHLPFLFDPDRGEHGTLLAHVARANPVWKQFSDSSPSVVVFQGPQSYISPAYYPSKAEHGKVAPTWNYAVVHAHGLPRAIHERQWLLEHVTQQTATREAGEATPWQVSDAPEEFVEGLLRGIVGIEITITRLVGKWKINQNLSLADQRGAVAGLTARGGGPALEMAELMRSRLP